MRFAALLVAGFALLFAAPTASAEGFADGFGVRPIKRHGEKTAASYFELKARPGEKLVETVVLSNASKEKLTVLVDGVDGLTGKTTGVVYANRDDARTETSLWLKPFKKQVTLQPKESRRMRFTVTIPADARPGDHLAGLAFQDTHQDKSSDSKFSVKQVVRIVMGVQITVDGGSKPQIDLGGLKLAPLPGTEVPSVVLALHNKGQLLCKPKASVTLTPPDGPAQTSTLQLDTVLPDDQIDFPLPFKGALKAGTYKADASVDGCGAHQETSVEASLKESLSGTTPGTEAAPIVEKASTPLWLLLAVALGGAFGGTGLAIFFVKRRTHDNGSAAA